MFQTIGVLEVANKNLFLSLGNLIFEFVSYFDTCPPLEGSDFEILQWHLRRSCPLDPNFYYPRLLKLWMSVTD